MVIAGKLGLYSLLRFHIGLFPVQARAAAPYLIALAVVGILYGACLALAQRDFWRLLAFAALSHLSLIVLGLYGFTLIGSTGAIYQILSHGLADATLFLLLGFLYDSCSTSQINAYGGLAARLPRTATLFVIATLAMIGLPLLSGFVGEFLVLSSTFGGVSRTGATLATLGVILGAAYMLWLVQRLFYGSLSDLTSERPALDLGLGQLLVLCPLAVLMLVLGLAPNLWLPSIQFGVHPPQARPAVTTQQESLNLELNREVQR
jgi:NADH-quinone oxidoreductase subunit M